MDVVTDEQTMNSLRSHGLNLCVWLWHEVDVGTERYVKTLKVT